MAVFHLWHASEYVCVALGLEGTGFCMALYRLGVPSGELGVMS